MQVRNTEGIIDKGLERGWKEKNNGENYVIIIC